SISLATVYNCLESLVGCKVLNRLNIAGTPSHYEMRGPQHHHFRCVACGKIFDFEARLPVTRLAEETGFRVTDCQLQLSGYCPACQQKENQTL
ncbi:MAG: transcriptional repressor, partial [Verrucomicrobiae bacterium]|nr:transcriptional repressor [Verrucomicrobiae bacterium]